jgi:putative ABC transport system permease protein
MLLLKKNTQHSGRRVMNARILGTTPEFLDIKGIVVQQGRFFNKEDARRGSNVVVLGSTAVPQLFGFSDPIGKTVLIGSSAFRVVGVLRPRLEAVAPGGADTANPDQELYMPLKTARNRFGNLQVVEQSGGTNFERVQLNEITLAVHNENLVSQTAEMARILLKRHHPHTVDYEIQVPLELLRQAQREKRIWNIVLGSIAGILLLVGGIGIMNIMLATVTERTREIGIRRAMGARRLDITIQFLVETVALSTIGGIIGIIVGVGSPWFLTAIFGIDAYVAWWTVVLAFVISVGTGIVFGVYPARRAAAMSPIEALRHE